MQDEAGANLRRGAAGDLLASKTETTKPAERGVQSELLPEVEAEPALDRSTCLGDEGLDAIGAGAQAQKILRHIASLPEQRPVLPIEVRPRRITGRAIAG